MKITVKQKKPVSGIAPEDLQIGELYSFSYGGDQTKVVGLVIGRQGQPNQFVPLDIELGGRFPSDDKVCKPWELDGNICGKFTPFSGQITLKSNDA